MAKEHRKAFQRMCLNEARAGNINRADGKFVAMSSVKENDMIYCYRAGYRLGGPRRPKKEKAAA